MSKKLKIVSISAEISPFSKTGGLADVAASLPRALKKLNCDVTAITPLYSEIIDKQKYKLELFRKKLEIKIDDKNKIKVNIWKSELDKILPIYFIENEKYFAKRKNIYGSNHENARFYLFNTACIELIKIINGNTNIIHCHDWHTGLIPYLIKKQINGNLEIFKNIATIFTIHNLAFQLGRDWWNVPAEKKDYGHDALPNFHDSNIENINFAKRGILYADIINAVSEQYAQEIMTKNFGQDLHCILKNRKDKLFGIINGINYQEYNPATDPGLKQQYDYNNINKKVDNKLYLQKYLGLKINKNIPIIGMTSRIAEQKGFDIFLPIIDVLLRKNMQIVIMGDGNERYINTLNKFTKQHPKKIKIIPFNQDLETSIYAGSDILLLPSRFEPCGINQLIALRYGCIPVVRHIGGLIDTIDDYNPKTQKGNGFSFSKYDSRELLVAITRAMEIYKYKESWKSIITNGMKVSHSWKIPAQKYTTLYKKALKNKQADQSV